jgi:hypothetical protein
MKHRHERGQHTVFAQAMCSSRSTPAHAHCSLVRGMFQRAFLPALLLRPPRPCAPPKGKTWADAFGLLAFGFLFSRLLLCCFFATSNLPSRFEVTDAGPI